MIVGIILCMCMMLLVLLFMVLGIFIKLENLDADVKKLERHEEL